MSTSEQDKEARPATSCYLKYPLPGPLVDSCMSWVLENSVKVKMSTNKTYFCVIGWSPAGYSGIQQISPTEKVAIFSMWNDGSSSVFETGKGPGVVVEPFGGEGTGLKSMMPLDWTIDSVVKFKVEGEKKNDRWQCSCYVEDGCKTHYMATFSRAGSRPLDSGGFYSFVEDWDRSPNAEGNKVCREAEFSDTRACFDGKYIDIENATFTKVETGLDKFASGKALAGINQGHFYLRTGGISEYGTRLSLE